jgi:cation diffusion facilitator family transporter
MTSAQGLAANRAINIGLTANAILAVLKVGFGVFGHSEALLADGINSTSDVAYYVVVKAFLFLADRPPDREHPYGHRQLESIAALAVGAFVITTAVALFWDAINSVYDMLMASETTGFVGLVALWVALLTAAAKVALTLYTQGVASRTGNAAILALAKDHRNDIFSASGAAAGIVASRCGYPWADPFVGGVVAIVVLLTGIQILRESSADLMDAVPSEALDCQTREALRGLPGVKAVEEVHAHRFGPYLIMNITIGVDGATTVAEGDRIASDVEETLCTRIELVRRAYVHYHPAQADESPDRPTSGRRTGGMRER